MGGRATIAHGLPRSTLDVDIYADPTVENVGKLVAALSKVGSGVARELDPNEILKHRIFLFADQIRVDVFIGPAGLAEFKECWNRRWEKDFESTKIPFLGMDDLICSKHTGREQQDTADIEALEKIRKNEKT